MAKDAKGHGSEARGVSGVQARNDRMATMFERARAQGHSTFNANADAEAAGVLAQGHPKSDSVPVHPDASGRSDSFFGRLNDKQSAAQNKEANAFQRSRRSSGPHYLDPKDPRGRR